MSDDKREIKDLEIFELCEALAEKLYGEKEAIADIKQLYNDHKEMFDDIRDVFNTISRTVENPEIIMDNPKKEIGGILVAKKFIEDKKMGDVILRNEKGTNRVLHSNKKNIKKFATLEKKQSLVGSPNSYNVGQESPAYKSDVTSSVISTTVKSIIPQNSEKKPFKPTKKYQDKDIEK